MSLFTPRIMSRESSEPDKVAHAGAEGVGERAEHVDAHAHPARLYLPQVGLVGARHRGEVALREVRREACLPYCRTELFSASLRIHATSVSGAWARKTC